jgi:hypothetical protein
MTSIDAGGPDGSVPSGPPLDRWELAVMGPSWRPPPGEFEVRPVPGSVEVHPDSLVFRALDVVDVATGSPVVAVIPATSIRTIGPLAPGSPGVGAWLPKWQRRLRSPGFVVGTDAGAWVFDGPDGPKRASALSQRFGVA